MNKASLPQAIAIFFSKTISYTANLFSFLSQKVDNKALALKEKSEDMINIPQLRAEYEVKINDQLDIQYEAFKKLTTEIELGQKKLTSDKLRFEKTAREIVRAEDEAATVNTAEMTNIERMQHEFGLKNMRLEAATLMRNVQFNEKFLGEQQQTLEAMAKNYHENKFKAKQVISELTSLEHRNALLETKQSIEHIELGLSNYKVSDILLIVEGKEAAADAAKFADAVLLREGGKTVTDLRIEASETLALEDDLNKVLNQVRSGEQILLN